MKTPKDSWIEYRDFVYAAELPESDENERMRAFFAGAESVFKLLESFRDIDGTPIFDSVDGLEQYREANRVAAMETMPPEDRLIVEIERKSALGEIE